MQQLNFEQILEAIVAGNPRYHREAYHFLREALDHTQKQTNKNTKGTPRHVTGQELLEGIRQYAIDRYGPMAITLLEEWGVKSTADFGEMVFTMIDARLLSKTETDTREDFKNVYDFQTAFVDPFVPRAKLKKQTPATPAPATDK